MDKPTLQKSTSPKAYSQFTSEQTIAVQNFGTFRKTDEQKNSFIITTTESLFKRQCTEPKPTNNKFGFVCTEPGILLLVLYYCDRPTILDVRLTSQGFYYLASKIPTPNLLCPLASVSAIYHQPFSELPTLSIQNKLDFIQENNLEVFINIPLVDLPRPPVGPTIIPEDKLFFTSTITDITELNQLQTWLSNQQIPQSISKLRKLDFSKLPLDAHVHPFTTLFTTIAQNLATLSSLTTIVTSKIPPNFVPPLLIANNRIITIKQVEEQPGILTPTNVLVAGAVGLGLFGFFKWWFSSSDPEDKKKK